MQSTFRLIELHNTVLFAENLILPAIQADRIQERRRFQENDGDCVLPASCTSHKDHIPHITCTYNVPRS